MSSWIDPHEPVLAAITALAGELADPIRVTTLQLLATEGPHTMTQLAEALGIPAPRLANHLARLRVAGLVAVERNGRHAVYRVAAAGIGDVLTVLSRYAGNSDPPDPTARPTGPADIAHSCYDHAAGRLGVRVFATLVERGALRAPDGHDPELALGADLSVLAEWGVDPHAVDAGRRKPATACLDKTYRLPHLGGALGSTVLDAFVARDLVRPRPGTRVLAVTPRGARELPTLLPGFAALPEQRP